MTDTAHLLRILDIMRALRDPETGCPWDIEQTFTSIAPYTIEEAYEVADAIENGDMATLKDELGDLLLQVVFHAQMAEEIGQFNFFDVAAAISDKMERRHPHVFGTPESIGTDKVKSNWEDIKARERAEKSANQEASLLDDVPTALPGLSRAVKLQSRAARVGSTGARRPPFSPNSMRKSKNCGVRCAAQVPTKPARGRAGRCLICDRQSCASSGRRPRSRHS